MKIAFVGKGGSGKTTLSALFTLYMSKRSPVLAIDGDLNMHLAPLLGLSNPSSPEKHISHPAAVETIKTYLRGQNSRIKELIHFRKTTPPTAESNFIHIEDPENPILNKFGISRDSLSLLVVGSYEAEEIGAGCYHNNLAILENVLSHTVDTKSVVVADMVAGVDAFANTLHAQFDMLVLAVEPTRRGVEVFNQYKKLAEEAGVDGLFFVIGNKIRSEGDEKFLRENIPASHLLGLVKESDYLRAKDQEGGALDINQLEKEQLQLLGLIEEKLFSKRPDYQTRLHKLFDLHRKYVDQASIKERFGDLTNQIDPDFNLEVFMADHEKNSE